MQTLPAVVIAAGIANGVQRFCGTFHALVEEALFGDLQRQANQLSQVAVEHCALKDSAWRSEVNRHQRMLACQAQCLSALAQLNIHSDSCSGWTCLSSLGESAHKSPSVRYHWHLPR